MNQPDFKEIFFETFSNKAGGIHYKVRRDSNFQHDIHFLFSLIKDARFRLGGIRHEKSTVIIPLARARWELRDEVAKGNLVEIPSELRLGRVKKIQWIAKDVTLSAPYEGSLVDAEDAISGATVCEIDAMFIGESTHIGNDGGIEVVLVGYPGDWKLRVSLSSDSWSLSVSDSKTA